MFGRGPCAWGDDEVVTPESAPFRCWRRLPAHIAGLTTVLAQIAAAAGRLVEKDSLLRSVWPDVAFEEGNVTKGVFSLRQILDEERGVRYIPRERNEAQVPRGSLRAGENHEEAPGDCCQQWARDPFVGRIVEGFIWGRG
jgi:hypothetical protein